MQQIIRTIRRSLILAIMFCVVAAPSAQAADPEDKVYVLPTAMCRGYFFLPIDLAAKKGYPQDRRLWFIHDTGASDTYVDPDAIIRTTGKRVRSGQRVNITGATLGPLKINKLGAKLQHLDHLSKALGRQIDGILQYDAFKNYLMILDYKNGQIRLEEGSLPRPDGKHVYSVKGPDKRPWLDIAFHDRTRRMLLDSGAALTDLAVKSIDSFDTQQEPVLVGASFRLNAVKLKKAARSAFDASLGPHVLEKPLLQSASQSELIGGGVMEHFNWTFDVRKKRVRIDPHTPGAPIRFESSPESGLVYKPVEKGFIVHRIIEGLPASKVDVRLGDLITHFNGASLSERGCDMTSSEVLTLGIERDNQFMEIDVPLFNSVD